MDIKRATCAKYWYTPIQEQEIIEQTSKGRTTGSLIVMQNYIFEVVLVA